MAHRLRAKLVIACARYVLRGVRFDVVGCDKLPQGLGGQEIKDGQNLGEEFLVRLATRVIAVALAFGACMRAR